MKDKKGEKGIRALSDFTQSYSCMWLKHRLSEKNKTAGEDKRTQRRKGRTLGESNEYTGERWREPVKVVLQ